VIGHIWPLWHGFRGGKGAATLAGTLLALAPVLLAVAVAAWLVVAMAWGFVGLATIFAALAAALAAALLPLGTDALATYAFAMAALVAFAHRGNIARMRAGTEPRAAKLWLFAPRGPSR
jgi:glycerol-3-phosphate acyltransferase PlsY